MPTVGGDNPLVRADTMCPLCSRDKPRGLVACWSCFRNYDMRHGNPIAESRIADRETTLRGRQHTRVCEGRNEYRRLRVTWLNSADDELQSVVAFNSRDAADKLRQMLADSAGFLEAGDWFSVTDLGSGYED